MRSQCLSATTIERGCNAYIMLTLWRGVRTAQPTTTRRLTTTSILSEKALPPRRKLIETEIEENFLKGSGPGGQKINKTSCAVQLKHLPSGTVVKCQETRSREQNRKIARQILGERLDEMEKGGESRTAIKAARASAKKASANKKARRKYKKLDQAKQGEGGGEGEEAEGKADEATPPKD